jgi:hypothetical protein
MEDLYPQYFESHDHTVFIMFSDARNFLEINCTPISTSIAVGNDITGYYISTKTFFQSSNKETFWKYYKGAMEIIIAKGWIHSLTK